MERAHLWESNHYIYSSYFKDFGSVAAPTFGTMAGTPNWLAPEVINLERVTFVADIWSLGCTCLEYVIILANGRSPVKFPV